MSVSPGIRVTLVVVALFNLVSALAGCVLLVVAGGDSVGIRHE